MTTKDLIELVHLLLMCGIQDKSALESGNLSNEEWLKMMGLIDKFQSEKPDPKAGPEPSDLIHREALKEKLQGHVSNGTYAAFYVNDVIDNAPTIDAVVNTIPVRSQGEWKIQPHSMIMRCSLCGHEETAKDVGTINPDIHFCSSCGAEMQTKEDTPCPCIDCIFKSTDNKKDCAYCEAWYKWSLE